jgi:transposase
METERVDYAAWIGLDWGSYKHAVCLQVADSSSTERCTLEQKPEALHSWFTNLHDRFPGRTLAVAIEQTRGAVINFLLSFDFAHVFRIHPKSLKNYRDALHPSGAKDDPTDAELLLQFLKLHRDKIKPWVPDEPEMRSLLRLTEFRRKTVDKRVRLTNELTQLLKDYFPGALDWAGELDAVMACDFLSKWPTLATLQKSDPDDISKFYREHGSRRRNLTGDRLKQIRSALPLTTDQTAIETSALMVRIITPQLRSLIDAIAHFDLQIQRLFRGLSDSAIFGSFPGAGSALAPRLMAVMGSDRSRFNSSEEVARYSGIAPVTERSGKATWIHRRLACSQFVKQSFHEFAAQSILQCDWARAYYNAKKREGKGHHTAVRALAYRWIRIIYRCWKDRVPYNEQRYMHSLQQKRPTWLASLSSAKHEQ